MLPAVLAYGPWGARACSHCANTPLRGTMALVKCKECGNEVATSATSCPRCGKVRGGASARRYLPALGIFILLGIGVGLAVSNEMSSRSAEKARIARVQAEKAEEKARVVRIEQQASALEESLRKSLQEQNLRGGGVATGAAQPAPSPASIAVSDPNDPLQFGKPTVKKKY